MSMVISIIVLIVVIALAYKVSRTILGFLRKANTPKDLPAILVANNWPADTTVLTLGYSVYGNAYLLFKDEAIQIVDHKTQSKRSIPISNIVSVKRTRLGAELQTKQGAEKLHFANVLGPDYEQLLPGAAKTRIAAGIFMNVCERLSIPTAQR